MNEIEKIRIFYSPNGEGRLIAVVRNLKAKWYRYTPRRAARIILSLNRDWDNSYMSDGNRQDVYTARRRLKP